MSDRQLSSKLRSAINAGDHKAVQRLVKGGVDVNARFWVGTIDTVIVLLHYATTSTNSSNTANLFSSSSIVHCNSK